jgi:putative hemolysin
VLPTDLNSVLPHLLPVALPAPVQRTAARLLGIDELQRTYRALQSTDADRPIQERLLTRLSVTHRVGDRDLGRIPRNGPVVVVANHPFGILEGAILATILARVRPDVRFLANKLLAVIPEVRELLIPVDPIGGARAVRTNPSGLRRAIEFLRGGGCLVVFPAGEVSHYQWRERAVTDSEWNTAVARMVETASRKGVAVSVVPIHISGANSLMFQTLGLMHPRFRTALLPRELLNKMNRLVELRIGSPIESGKLLEIPTAEERTAYLRWRTYVLANRSEYKPRTSLPFTGRMRRDAPQQSLTPAVDSARLSADIARLAAEHSLTKLGELEVYIAPARLIPNVLEEIGRLREVTFRHVGEGTGKATDLDRFDAHYLHLFAWNASKREIVGAYRVGGTEHGAANLYTATLFKYGKAFLDKLGPALELGRSFVRAEYQKGFAPLLALWKGIGKYVAQNPQYKVLFGPVSISNQYQSISRELMVTFLERHAPLREWVGLVSNRNPFRRKTQLAFPSSGFDIEDLSQVVSDLEPSRAGVPVLLRQYLRLGGKLLGFNVDPEFADAVDGLILVDLTKTERKLLERYLGKAEASKFLAFQEGNHGT